MKKFKKNMTVIWTFRGIGGYTETAKRKVHSVKKGVVYLDDGNGEAETGITYSATTGRELENFFAGMRAEIKPE